MRKRILKWTFRLLLLIITLSLCANLYHYWGYRQAQQELRALGYPATLAELREWGALENPEDSAHIPIEQALATMTWNFPDDLKLPFTNSDCDCYDDPNPYSPEILNDIKLMLDTNGEALDILRNSRHLEFYRPIVVTDLYDLSRLEMMAECRGAARFLSEAAIYHAGTGNIPLAIEYIDTILWLATMLEQYPDDIDLLVAQAFRGMGNRDAIDFAERYDPSVAELRGLIEIVEKRTRAYDPMRALGGANAQYSRELPVDAVLSHVAELDGFNDWLLYIVDDFLGDVYFIASGRHLKIVTAQHAGFMEFLDMLDMNSSYQDVIDSGVSEWEPGMGMDDYANVMTWEMHFAAHYLQVAKIECGIAALKTELFRIENGHLPESLQDLVPDFADKVPTDPMTGDPLKYRRLENGFKVYSLGLDRQDCHDATESEDEPCAEQIEFSNQHP